MHAIASDILCFKMCPNPKTSMCTKFNLIFSHVVSRVISRTSHVHCGNSNYPWVQLPLINEMAFLWQKHGLKWLQQRVSGDTWCPYESWHNKLDFGGTFSSASFQLVDEAIMPLSRAWLEVEKCAKCSVYELGGFTPGVSPTCCTLRKLKKWCQTPFLFISCNSILVG